MLSLKKINTTDPVAVQDFANRLATAAFSGTAYYVDGTNGVDTADGKTFNTALKTIAEAVSRVSAGDTIFLKGSFDEAVDCDVASVRFVGLGPTWKDCQWTKAAVAGGGYCLKIAANYVTVENIYFRPSPYVTSGVPSAIYLSGANWATIRNCRFQGRTDSYKAIYSPTCDSDNVTIEGCEFMYMNTATHGAGIWGVNAGGFQYSGWRILNNIFHSCVTAIKISCRCATVVGNTIMEYGINPAGAVAQLLALGIDLAGTDSTNSGCNSVWGNQLGGTYNATLYKVGATGDQWGGNFNVISGGLTAANPA